MAVSSSGTYGKGWEAPIVWPLLWEMRHDTESRLFSQIKFPRIREELQQEGGRWVSSSALASDLARNVRRREE